MCNPLPAKTTQKLNSMYFQSNRAPNGEFGSEISQMSSDTNHTSGFVDAASLDTAGKGNVSRLADTYLSPTYSNQSGAGQDIWQLDEMQPFSWSFQQSDGDKGLLVGTDSQLYFLFCGLSKMHILFVHTYYKIPRVFTSVMSLFYWSWDD